MVAVLKNFDQDEPRLPDSIHDPPGNKGRPQLFVLDLRVARFPLRRLQLSDLRFAICDFGA
jgi:hypothetical protein